MERRREGRKRRGKESTLLMKPMERADYGSTVDHEVDRRYRRLTRRSEDEWVRRYGSDDRWIRYDEGIDGMDSDTRRDDGNQIAG